MAKIGEAVKSNTVGQMCTDYAASQAAKASAELADLGSAVVPLPVDEEEGEEAEAEAEAVDGREGGDDSEEEEAGDEGDELSEDAAGNCLPGFERDAATWQCLRAGPHRTPTATA